MICSPGTVGFAIVWLVVDTFRAVLVCLYENHWMKLPSCIFPESVAKRFFLRARCFTAYFIYSTMYTAHFALHNVHSLLAQHTLQRGLLGNLLGKAAK